MEYWAYVLIAAGLLLLFVEIFFIPGFGLAGILGLLCLLGGIYMFSKEHGPLYAALLFVGCVGVLVATFMLFFRSPASNLLILKDKLRGQNVEKPALPLGQRGITLTPLYPTGKAAFVVEGGEKRLDVIAGGEFIELGKDVRVTRIEGNRIFVEPLG